MITRAIGDYVNRDWGLLRDNKDRYWSDRIVRLGPLEGWRIADQLRRQVLAQNPSWPDADQRHDDVMAHVYVAECLRRAGSTRRG